MKKKCFWSRKQSRKTNEIKKENTVSTKKATKEKRKKNFLFCLIIFMVESVFFFLTFLFSFIISHLSLLAQRIMLYVVLPLVDASLEVTAPVLPLLLANITVRITHASIEPRYVM